MPPPSKYNIPVHACADFNVSMIQFLASDQLDQYCTDIAETATWGGQLEV